MLPNFLIVGADRCGTTWLAKNLMSHPGIYILPYKEVHFFDIKYGNGISFYENIYRGRHEQFLGDATPEYLYFEDVCSKIYRHIPDAKIIISLRNPADRACSHYWNLVAKAKSGEVNREISFEEKIKITPRLVQEGMYAKKVKKYFDTFPSEDIKILLSNDIKTSPDTVLTSVTKFLGADFTYKSPKSNVKINAANSKLGKYKSLYYLQKASLKIGANRLAGRIDSLNSRTLPKLNLETRSTLMNNFYKDDIAQLETLIDRDLSAWMIPSK